MLIQPASCWNLNPLTQSILLIGYLQFSILTLFHFTSSVTCPFLSFHQLTQLSFPYLFNSPPTVRLCNNFHLFLFFIFIPMYFFLFPSLVFFVALFPWGLSEDGKTTADCLLFPRLILAQKNKALIVQLFNILGICGWFYCHFIAVELSDFFLSFVRIYILVGGIIIKEIANTVYIHWEIQSSQKVYIISASF